ncbi:MAG: hypothetical protein RL641_120 [Candidatus Parcubacteria bacterium]
MKIAKKDWNTLTTSLPGKFQSYKNPSRLRMIRVKKLALKLREIINLCNDPDLIKRLLSGPCIFLERPVIRHQDSVEFNFAEKCTIAEGLRKKSPDVLYKMYRNNKLKVQHLVEAINAVNWYIRTGRPITKDVLASKLVLEKVLNISNLDHLRIYEALKYEDKMAIVKKAEKYLIAVLTMCIEHETKQVALNKKMIVEEEVFA